jgi:putative chitinase
MLTAANLQAGCGASASLAASWLAPISSACMTYGINTPLRLAAFLATIGVESEYLTATAEDLDYSAHGLADTWPHLFAGPNALANSLARKPQAIANTVYANENGNGDAASGDGWKFRGQGLIELTGRSNYAAAAARTKLDIVNHPELLQVPMNAAIVSADFWTHGNLNALADTRSMTAISKYVNCGNANSEETPNGLAERLTLYRAACKSFGV